MPRNAQGIYSLPSSNPVVEGTVIEATWANETMDDIATQLNNVITRDGTLGPTGPFLFADGSAAAPGIAFTSQPGTGIYRNSSNSGLGFSSQGVQIAGMHNLGVSIPGTKKGFYAEMTDSNIQNRFTFITSQANKNTILQIAPNGTGDPSGRGAALLVLSDQQDPNNFYATAVGAGEFTPGQQRCALRLYKVGSVPDVPLVIAVDEQVMMQFYENSVIAIGGHTPAPWVATSAYDLKFFEFGKPGWIVGANLAAAPDFYALSTVCNAYSDGTNWRLAANSPYGVGKASAGLFVMRGDQAIFGLNTNTGQNAGDVIAWAPSMVVDWSTLGDNKVGVYGQVRAWQFVATATP
jgi:hypothetical protein